MIFIQSFHSFYDTGDFPTPAPFLLFPANLDIAFWPKLQSLRYHAGTIFETKQTASAKSLLEIHSMMSALLHLQNTQE
jgi:hypothetical protein